MARRRTSSAPGPLWWAVTAASWLVAAGVWWASRVDTLPPDGRRSIPVSAEEQEIIRAAMRETLESVDLVLQAAGRGDLPAAAAAAQIASQLPGPAARSESLRARLPPEWRALGRQVDEGLAQAAKAAANGTSPIAGVAQATTACVTCHRTFRLDVTH